MKGTLDSGIAMQRTVYPCRGSIVWSPP